MRWVDDDTLILQDEDLLRKGEYVYDMCVAAHVMLAQVVEHHHLSGFREVLKNRSGEFGNTVKASFEMAGAGATVRTSRRARAATAATSARSRPSGTTSRRSRE